MKQKIDKDGNPVVDESGNPVMADEGSLTPEEELEKVKQERDTLLQTKETLVSEVQDLRKKKQLTEEEKQELADKLAQLEQKKDPTPDTDDNVIEQVKELLSQQEQKNREKNKDKAYNKFIAKHPELSPANDEAGIKKAAFEKKLNMFNMSSLEDESDFLEVFESTYKLLGHKEEEIVDDPSVVNNPNPPKIPNSGDQKKLSPKEIDYVNKHFGGNVDRYIELKTKYPQVVQNLQ